MHSASFVSSVIYKYFPPVCTACLFVSSWHSSHLKREKDDAPTALVGSAVNRLPVTLAKPFRLFPASVFYPIGWDKREGGEYFPDSLQPDSFVIPGCWSKFTQLIRIGAGLRATRLLPALLPLFTTELLSLFFFLNLIFIR